MSHDSATRNALAQGDAIKDQADAILAASAKSMDWAMRKILGDKNLHPDFREAVSMNWPEVKRKPCGCDFCRGEDEAQREEAGE